MTSFAIPITQNSWMSELQDELNRWKRPDKSEILWEMARKSIRLDDYDKIGNIPDCSVRSLRLTFKLVLLHIFLLVNAKNVCQLVVLMTGKTN